MDKKTILFTGYYFASFSGSMMHICEMGVYFANMGYKVSIATVHVAPQIENYVNNLGLEIFRADKTPTDITYDIVWAYHYPILSYLLNRNLKYKKIISGCLSGTLVPLEIPNRICLNNQIPIFVNSEETKDNLVKNFPKLKNNIYKLLNIAPTEFYKNKKETLSEELNKIAIVSNHIPKELLKIIKPLSMMNIKVDCYGGTNNIAITPQILSKYDVIITIGKTVQYALVMGIPVYNYDIFGGNGYIRIQNIDKEEYYNFSGRSNNRKINFDDIICELLAYYKDTCKEIPQLQTIALDRYLITNVIPKILPIIHEQPPKRYKIDKLNIIQTSFLLQEIMNTKSNEDILINKKYQFWKNIFSVQNEYNGNTKRKIITILGIKIKFKIRNK